MAASIRCLLLLAWFALSAQAFAQTQDESAPADTDVPEASESSAAQEGSQTAVEPMTLTLHVHPIFPPDQAELVYRPLLNYLSATTPHQFELSTSRDFHRFWLEIRRGNMPDLVLEDAHLIALRIQRDGYMPLVKAAEPATFSLLTNSMSADPQLQDFVARPVSSMPAPSLGYLILSSWYPNPMQQPRILSNAASWLDAIEIVFSMEAEAAIAPHNLVARYVNMVPVRTSEEFPHATIAASPSVPADVQNQIREALLTLHENGDHFTALHELDIDQFVPAQVSEYSGLEQWLSDIYVF
ncbi:phosphate/phosphite/phosphonate ABC transporter substrate-binding protein [Wenzhouxiangella marina]|uniref:Uncharacterized protein n=1 Tax=Wenzhouxiangella marina TaxID=1579979 RepID=A0A0K0XWX5_9GAMM|nr:PhnD/SsuA/transferrin family substrate-binding protein [Wenzhouxiangella marina]AKS42183.1 hypothetical protein WM2015_1816 [Wenzhouxiangella marina]MBB6086045.1 hypothetical protein [Wenzhouxiangella marina]